MSRVDPCYCNQACAYEDLLERVRMFLGPLVNEDRAAEALDADIQATVKDYKQAQSEYASDDFEHCYDGCGCDEEKK